jgi:hypothetical protein
MGCGCSEGAGIFPMTGGGKGKGMTTKNCPKCSAKANTNTRTLTARDIKALESCMNKIKSVIEGAKKTNAAK